MSNQNFKSAVNEEFFFDDLSEDQLDIVDDDDGRFHILSQNRAFHAELLRADHAAKTFTIKVNGNVYTVALSDRYDQLVKRLGLETNIQHRVSKVTAPMPGLVLSVGVKEGQEVHRNDALLILEAMKMENVIKSPGDGTVKKIFVEKGNPVDKGQVLIELD